MHTAVRISTWTFLAAAVVLASFGAQAAGDGTTTQTVTVEVTLTDTNGDTYSASELGWKRVPAGSATLDVECTGAGCASVPMNYAKLDDDFKALSGGSAEWNLTLQADTSPGYTASVCKEEDATTCAASTTFDIDVDGN